MLSDLPVESYSLNVYERLGGKFQMIIWLKGKDRGNICFAKDQKGARERRSWNTAQPRKGPRVGAHKVGSGDDERSSLPNIKDSCRESWEISLGREDGDQMAWSSQSSCQEKERTRMVFKQRGDPTGVLLEAHLAATCGAGCSSGVWRPQA